MAMGTPSICWASTTCTEAEPGLTPPRSVSTRDSSLLAKASASTNGADEDVDVSVAAATMARQTPGAYTASGISILAVYEKVMRPTYEPVSANRQNAFSKYVRSSDTCVVVSVGGMFTTNKTSRTGTNGLEHVAKLAAQYVVGVFEGERLGARDGDLEGREVDGLRDGALDGERDGFEVVGALLGARDGDFVGLDVDGEWLGVRDGDRVGCAGARDGVFEGCDVLGALDGDLEGALLGELVVGLLVGLVGLNVGVNDGDLDGAMVLHASLTVSCTMLVTLYCLRGLVCSREAFCGERSPGDVR